MGVALKDSTQILYEFLTASGNSFNTAVGNRVWDREAASSFANTEKAVVFTMFEDVELRRTSQLCEVVIKCFGGDNKRSSARQTARLLFERLDDGSGTTATGGITLARCLDFDQGPFADPDTGWPIHVSKYEIRFY